MTGAFFLTGYLALALAAPRALQERGASPAESIEQALADIARPADMAKAAERMARLGAPGLPSIFALLASEGAGNVQHRAALLGAIALLPREPVLTFLAELARAGGQDDRREAGLDLLGRIGARADLKLVLELGSSSDPEVPPSPGLRQAMEGALLGICARDGGAVRALAGFFPRVGPAAQASIAAVLVRIQSEEAVSLLAGLLGAASGDADALLLLELGRAVRSSGTSDLLVHERVRGYLGNPDARLAVLACLASDKLGDQAAVPELIVLLEDGRANVRLGAHSALSSLTGVRLPAEARTWITWLDEALAWWDERSEACRVALVSGTPAEAAAAVHEVAAQRLYLQEVAHLLRLALLRPEPDIQRSAAQAFTALPPRSAREALTALSAHPDPVIAAQARTALQQPDRARPLALRDNPVRPHPRNRIQ